MKNFFRFIVLLLVTFLVALAAVGCTGGDTPGGETDPSQQITTTLPQEPQELVLAENGESRYVIMRNEDAPKAITELSKKLRDAFNQACGTSVKLATDFMSDESVTGGYEIVVGTTLDSYTEELEKSLVSGEDYIITSKDKKVYIIGATLEATTAGVDRFIEEFLKESTSKLVFGPESEILHKGVYKLTSLKLGDTELRRFKIVYSSKSAYSRDYAVALQECIKKNYGNELSVVSDTEKQSDYEILVGNPARVEARDVVASFQSKNVYWRVCPKGTKLILAAEGVMTGEQVTEAFIKYLDELPSGEHELSSLELSGDVLASLKSERDASSDIRVMTSNIAWTGGEEVISLRKRAEQLADIYLIYKPDVITFNEYYGDLINLLLPLIKDDYDIIASNFEDIFNGDYTGYTNSLEKLQAKTHATPIAVRRDSGLTVVDSGFRFTSEKWWIHSITWAVFKTEAGKTFGVCGNHYGSQEVGNFANDTLACIADIKAKHGDVPMIITGDLYSKVNEKAYNTLKLSLYVDTYYYSDTRVTVGSGSFHEIGSLVTGSSTPIDHILFAHGAFASVKHHLVADKYTKWASDHFPVYADLKIN